MKVSAVLVATAVAAPYRSDAARQWMDDNWWPMVVETFDFASNNWGEFTATVDAVSSDFNQRRLDVRPHPGRPPTVSGPLPADSAQISLNVISRFIQPFSHHCSTGVIPTVIRKSVLKNSANARGSCEGAEIWRMTFFSSVENFQIE